jgi:hypothetical protein
MAFDACKTEPLIAAGCLSVLCEKGQKGQGQFT